MMIQKELSQICIMISSCECFFFSFIFALSYVIIFFFFFFFFFFFNKLHNLITGIIYNTMPLKTITHIAIHLL